MQAVWADMELTQLPSWISPAPRNWGTTKRGKLSADELRVICTIHLVITLIRLWHDKSGREAVMLQNFMHVVSAASIAHLQVLSRNQKQAYNDLIFQYLRDVRSLFPDQKLKPVHHAALHIGHMMELFGPVHSYRAAFYERYIKFLHGINTNQKPGSSFLFRGVLFDVDVSH